MNTKWNFYLLEVKQDQPFIMLQHEAPSVGAQAILLANTEQPYPPHYKIYDKATNDFKGEGPLPPLRIYFPSFRVKKEDYRVFLKQMIIPGLVEYDHHLEEYKGWNILILRKDWGDTYEIGYALRPEITNTIDPVAQSVYREIIDNWETSICSQCGERHF
jgi:hypothetical protein